MLYSIIIMVVLIILSGVFAASEVALTAVSDNKIAIDAEKGNIRALRIQKFTSAPKSYLSSLQIFVTLIALVNGAIAVGTFSSRISTWFETSLSALEPLVIIISALILLVFQVVFGQMIPRRLANKYPEKIAYTMIGFINVVTILMFPIVWILEFVSNSIGRIFGLDPNDRERKMTEEEIRTIVEASGKIGNIDEEESEMIQNIFDFSDTDVEEIMTHRTEISAINVKSTKSQVLAHIKDEQYTRYPVYEGDIDHIVGTLHVKELLKYIDNNEEKFSLKALIRSPYFVPDSKKTSDLFREMQKQKNHIAVVLDEYGGTAGIVTIEDLIEEIVGNIFDEYDEIDDEVKIIDEYTYEINGLCNIHDVEDIIEAGLPTEDYDTLSGFILGQLGRFPSNNESIEIEFNGFNYKVLETEDKIISKVKVTKPKDSDESFINE
ncbi:MAG: HlyC/CorC family transporter [Acholeplasmataceae bacterium]|nr:HlyC/CorC family transporter [Acholeplasmataceae bacterium]